MIRWIMATDHRHAHGFRERRELSGEGVTNNEGAQAPELSRLCCAPAPMR